MGRAKPHKWPHMRFYAQRGSLGYFRRQRGPGRSQISGAVLPHPGLARSDVVESELAARGLPVFPSDTVADYWHHRIRGKQIIASAMRRQSAWQGHFANFTTSIRRPSPPCPVYSKRSRKKVSIIPCSGRGGRRFKSCHYDQYLAEFHQSSGTDYGADTSLVFAVAKAQYRKHCMCCIAPPL